MKSEEFLLQKDPLAVLNDWLSKAKTLGLREPTAMTIATVNSEGQPSSRVVLLKEIRADGVVFYTNYNSRKGLELAGNPKIAATLFWDPMLRQVNLVGQVSRLSRAESEAYWNMRERESQISQTVSSQSQPVADRATLDNAYVKAEKEFSGRPIPCPEHWGGYLMKVQEMEFWIGQPNRFHDRYHYLLVEGQWQNRRLSP